MIEGRPLVKLRRLLVGGGRLRFPAENGREV
jgi:hypothetical protein